MIKFYCDACNTEVDMEWKLTKIEFNDGEHPHNGSTMSCPKDLCPTCMRTLSSQLKLYSHNEWSEVRKSLNPAG